MTSSSVDTGHGIPIVMIPGIQGHWQWMAPAVDALAQRHRVLSFSLEETGREGAFDDYLDQVDAVLDRAGLDQAVILGVSFGGLIAARYAARRPQRTLALVLVVTPSPPWQPTPRVSRYLAHPGWSVPAFAARAGLRLVPEVLAALPRWRDRIGFLSTYGARVLRFPISPARMTERARRWARTNVTEDCRHITAPTLVITGEPRLDRVVPVEHTLTYLDLISCAQHVVLANTGHVGLVSRPAAFADLVGAFVATHVSSYDGSLC